MRMLSHCFQIKRISLVGENIKDKEAKAVSKLIKKVNILEMHKFKFTKIGIELLAKRISERKTAVSFQQNLPSMSPSQANLVNNM